MANHEQLRSISGPAQPEKAGEFTPEQQATLDYRRHILSGIAQFIGKDFAMPVEYGQPGGGWHWDTQANRVQADPAEVLERELDESRFIIAHEGGHRRISRLEVCDHELLHKPGFMFLLNAIEDPRVNNFVTEAYPRFEDFRDLAYQRDLDIEGRVAAESGLAKPQRFVQAGFAFIKAWYAEEAGQTYDMSKLDDDVRQAVEQTLASARDAWLTYPSKRQADSGEATTKAFMQASYEIIRDQVWPEFAKLIEKDTQDETLNQMQQQASAGEKGEAGEPGGEGQAGEPEQAELSTEQRQALQEAYDGLSEDQKQAMRAAAEATIRELEGQINQALGELDQDKEVAQIQAGKPEEPGNQPEPSEQPTELPESAAKTRLSDQAYTQSLEQKLRQYASNYEKTMAEVAPLIDQLEQHLREIFHARRTHGWQSGHRRGKRLDIRKRMQETAQGVSAVESQAWQRREQPTEKDYAISLLVDLSGSMQGSKIEQTFKAVVVAAEALGRLGISTEITGFHNELREYKPFDQPLSQTVRAGMDGMPNEVHSHNAQYNDDGWALQQAAERLASRPEAEKFLLAFSDGQPAPSGRHAGEEYDLATVVSQLQTHVPVKLVGLGIGPDTEHVATYYPNSVADVSLEQMIPRLSDLLQDMIENPDEY